MVQDLPSSFRAFKYSWLDTHLFKKFWSPKLELQFI
jgi:hypothetical protein